jgi:L-threonylcarbamoyladenylate synthase
LSASSPIRLPDAAGIAEATAALRAGLLVGMPTETVYGLAADALLPAAVARIFSAKGRPHFDPLILHVFDASMAEPLCFFNAWAERLAATFWPGPLTMLLPRRSPVPDLVTAGLPNVAVRAPDHPAARSLLAAFGGPLAAPSANRFGRISPTTAAHVVEELGHAITLVLDGGACRVGLESTIVDLSGDTPRLLRRGAILPEALAETLGRPVPWGRPVQVVAPGQLDAHYAPRTPLWRSSAPLSTLAPRWPAGAAALCLAPPLASLPGPTLVLSPDGDLETAAVRLFAHMRALDALEAPMILADPIPSRGIGAAIADRLLRASAGEVTATPQGLHFQPRA